MFTIYASNYAPIDPLVPPCDISLIPIGYVGENRARCLVFDLTECVETFGDGGFQISYIRPDDLQPYIVLHTDRLENNAIWEIDSSDTAQAGNGLVQLLYSVGNTVCKSALYRTVVFESNEENGDAPDPYDGLLDQIAAYASQSQAAANTATAAAAAASTAVEEGIQIERSQRRAADDSLNEKIDSLQAAVGAPLTVTQASAMTDANKIYVYTGSETGYTFGDWYYYNGAEWVSGGVYNSAGINLDDTLTKAGYAAEAKTTGDRINAAFVTKTATAGSICSFDDGADNVPVKGMTVDITAVQSGTGDPSPTNIRPINGYTVTRIYSTNKNLLQIVNASGTNQGITYLFNQDGSVTVDGTSTGTNSFRNLNYMSGRSLLPKGVPLKCALKKSNNNNILGMRLYVDGSSPMSFAPNFDDDAWHYSPEFTIPETATTAYVRMNIYTSGTTIDNVTAYPMVIRADETVEEFVKYDNTNYRLISLESAGTVYGGTLDVTTGMLTVTHFSNKINELTWQYNTSNYFVAFYYANPYLNDNLKPKSDLMCSSYLPVPWDTVIGNLPDLGIKLGTNTTAQKNVYIRHTAYSNNLDGWLEAVGDQRIVFEYENPVSYQLSPTEVNTLLGINNIWADTGDITNLEYRADTGILIEKLTNAIVSLGGNV